jgi:hypothetical protein
MMNTNLRLSRWFVSVNCENCPTLHSRRSKLTGFVSVTHMHQWLPHAVSPSVYVPHNHTESQGTGRLHHHAVAATPHYRTHPVIESKTMEKEDGATQ